MLTLLEKRPRPGAHAAHAHPRADARTRRAGRGKLHPLRPQPQAHRRAHHRRRLLRRPDQEARSRRRRPDRHARPPARPLRARQDPDERRRDPRHRRGRPHARHGLHPGHRAHLQAPAVHPPDAVLLGDHAAGDQAPRRHSSCRTRSGSRRRSRRPRRPPSASISSPSGREPVDKRAVLRALIRGATDFKNAIIFCNRKRDVATLQRSLAKPRLQRRRAARRHGPALAHGDARRFPQGQADAARRQRRRRARPRYPGGQPHLQFRRADPRRGLHPPHRPHRPRRPHRHRRSPSPRRSTGNTSAASRS